MSTFITDRDPITVFTPPAKPRPVWLVDARIAADESWEEYDRIVTIEVHAPEAEIRSTNHKRITEALNEADNAEKHYRTCHTAWQIGMTPSWVEGEA